MSFRTENYSVLVKYNDIWNKIKGLLGTKFHSMLVYDEKYIKTKVKAFNGFVHTIFEGNEIPKNLHSTCIAFIDVELELNDSDGSDSE